MNTNFRINNQIRIREVRLIGPDGAQLGIMPTINAQLKAQEFGLDLIEISPMAKPPVCKIADYGKMKYELSKKQKSNKARTIAHKTVQLTPKTGENDFVRKISDAQRFLDEGHKVSICVNMKGRELKHAKLIKEEVIEKITKLLTNGKLEPAQINGNKITMACSKNV